MQSNERKYETSQVSSVKVLIHFETLTLVLKLSDAFCHSIFFSVAQQPSSSLGRLIVKVYSSHAMTQLLFVGLP